MIRVKATREGLAGHKTASGYVIDPVVPFVALPSEKAVRPPAFVRIRNPRNGKEAAAIVLDVGPWDEHDDAYVFQPVTEPNSTVRSEATGEIFSTAVVVRPAAESGKDQFGRPTNGAGIDLSEAIWHQLGMTDNGEVEWEFLT